VAVSQGGKTIDGLSLIWQKWERQIRERRKQKASKSQSVKEEKQLENLYYIGVLVDPLEYVSLHASFDRSTLFMFSLSHADFCFSSQPTKLMNRGRGPQKKNALPLSLTKGRRRER
jgi:hypothetical protein